MMKWIIGALVGVVLVIGAFMILDPNISIVSTSTGTTTTTTDTGTVSSDSTTTSTTSETKVSIKIEGAVVNPGTYSLTSTSTWEDVIEKAGGLLDSADEDGYTPDKCIDGYDEIYIPYEAGYSEECVSVPTEKVNINDATAEELSSINGISTLLAEKIVAYREENGDFDSIEDLTKVSGIGTKTYEKIRDKVTIK